MIEQRAYDGYNVFFSKNFRVQAIVLDAEENSKSVWLFTLPQEVDDTYLSNSPMQGKMRLVMYEEYRLKCYGDSE